MSKASKWIAWTFVAASFVVPGVVAAAQQEVRPAAPAVSEESVDPVGDELALTPSFAGCNDPCLNSIQCRQRCFDDTVICVLGGDGKKHCVFPE